MATGGCARIRAFRRHFKPRSTTRSIHPRRHALHGENRTRGRLGCRNQGI